MQSLSLPRKDGTLLAMGNGPGLQVLQSREPSEDVLRKSTNEIGHISSVSGGGIDVKRAYSRSKVQVGAELFRET